jgi:hypothetical protein
MKPAAMKRGHPSCAYVFRAGTDAILASSLLQTPRHQTALRRIRGHSRFLSIAPRKTLGRSRRSFDVNVDVNVSACHQMDKFFLAVAAVNRRNAT